MSSTKLSLAGLMSQAIYGLNSNFAILSSGISEGLTLNDILNPGESVNKNSLNASFQSYLSQNFSAIDADGDGKISANDLSQYTNKLSQNGMSYQELSQLCYNAYGSASQQLEEILANFNEIDKNGDGRVTNEEIAAFNCDKEMEEVEKDHPKFVASNISNYLDD